MPISTENPVSTAGVNQSQPPTAERATGTFGERRVSIANASDRFVDTQQTALNTANMPEPRPIRTIHIRRPAISRATHHDLIDPRLETENPNTSLHSEAAIAERTKELAETKSAARLDDYIQYSHDSGNISDENKELFSTLSNYNRALDKQMVRIADLGDKLNTGKASPKEAHELNALLKTHKRNLSIVQGHLSQLDKENLAPEGKALTSAFEMRFAERHLDLADMTALFSDILPEQEPLSKGERIGYSLLQVRGCLRAVKQMPMSPGTRNKITKTLEAQCQKLEKHAALERGEYDPATRDLSLEEVLTEDFTLVKDKKKYSSSVLSPLTARWDEANRDFSQQAQRDLIPLSHPKISQAMLAELFVAHQLKASGVGKSDMPPVGFLLKQGIIGEINDQEWPVVKKELAFRMAGANHNATSTITPGGHLAKNFATDYPSNGISSMDRMQYKHVPNMAHSQMTAESGEVLFSGIRHGVIDPYMINNKNLKNLPETELSTMVKELLLDTGAIDIPNGQAPDTYATIIARQIKEGNPEMPDIGTKLRTESSKMMAKELLATAVVSDPEKMQAALDGETVGVSLNSISLVTPDALRARLKAGSGSDEKAMLAHQAESLKALAASGEPVVVNVRDNDGVPRSIKVLPKVRTLNFGVNKGAVATSKGVLGPNTPFWGRAMGWGFAASMNNPELRDMLGNPRQRDLGGAVAEKVAQMTASGDAPTQRRAALLEQAATQAKAIWRSGSFRSGGKEPYKMVSRLALVSHLMGETTLYNCKSGKDRTGQLDAEAKYLAAVGHTTGNIPEPDAEYTQESRRERTNFALNTGNHEVQQMTVGLKGYKLKGVPGLAKGMEADLMDVYQGGSKFVKT